jgi:hypothetical protein
MQSAIVLKSKRHSGRMPFCGNSSADPSLNLKRSGAFAVLAATTWALYSISVATFMVWEAKLKMLRETTCEIEKH